MLPQWRTSFFFRLLGTRAAGRGERLATFDRGRWRSETIRIGEPPNLGMPVVAFTLAQQREMLVGRG